MTRLALSDGRHFALNVLFRLSQFLLDGSVPKGRGLEEDNDSLHEKDDWA